MSKPRVSTDPWMTATAAYCHTHAGRSKCAAFQFTSSITVIHPELSHLQCQCLQAKKEVVEVNWEDQQDINTFGKLIQKHTMIKANMDDKKVQFSAVQCCSTLGRARLLQQFDPPAEAL